MILKNLKRSLVIGVAVLGCSALALAQASIAVVVNPRNSQSNIAMGDLRRVFIGDKRTWPDGSPVKLFTRAPGTPEHDSMLKVIAMSEVEYKQYWRSKVYQGDAQSEPAVLPSNGMQREALRAYPGGIALVDSTEVKDGMKVLKVDGKMPGDVGYPLQR